MFDELSARLAGVLRGLTGSGRLTEENIREALREVRRALLEADVHFKVARDLVKAVEERATGEDVLQGLKPGQQVVRVVHEELVRVLGGETRPFLLTGRSPRVVMLVGLQGVGKTTFSAKLAHWFKGKGSRPLLVAADTRRPAAGLQLATLAGKAGVASLVFESGETPQLVVRRGLEKARLETLDPVILDTQGRLHVDGELMTELQGLAETFEPAETLLVVDSMVGQDAVRSAEAFKSRLALTGAVLTKLDGDARGGAALSLAAATGVPVRLVSTGEGLESVDLFHPDRMASRILGMGDVLSLVEKAQAALDVEKAQETVRRVREEGFTLEDFREQLVQVRKLGPLRDILGMIPGASTLKVGDVEGEEQLVRVEAILNSMTPEERTRPDVLNGSRRSRIARGSGTRVEDVNNVLRDYRQMEKLMKSMGISGGRGKRRRGPRILRRR